MPGVIPYRILLFWLCAIFALRIVLQFVLQFKQVGFLPAFELWHSETVPYAMLLTMQCVLLFAMLAGAFSAGSQRKRPVLGKFLSLLAMLYLAIMICRLIGGVFDLDQHRWFNGAIPCAFHFALAAYLLVYASALKGSQQVRRPALEAIVQSATYPCVLGGSYMLFVWLLGTGSPLMFSAYLSVLIGASGILIHETLYPNREDWRPDRNDIVNDGLFLATVQIALPAFLKALSLFALLWLAQNHVLVPHSYWPHNAPELVQVLLMLVVAEFFRYWMHRASHKFKLLWKLHAVHHAADKLYTVNVGRFHPLDKTVQFLGDTLPFLLIGISPEVFAAYFVLYALNGFYQHSNADVKLGPLNWFIAGPELHRWHHSNKIAEAHANYGNNLIVWDTVFGTRYFPKNKQVARVGITNKSWPNSFIDQLSAPFTTPTERNTGERQG